jgi:hypothetical protein
MALEEIRAFLGWCTLINWVILFIWWAMIGLARDWVQGIHGKWFKIPEDRFDEIHYRGFLYFKVAVILFNFTPYLALRIAG